MRGTILCGVSDSPGGRAAAQLAGVLSDRLGLRLVLAHAVGGVPEGAEESLTARQLQTGAEYALDKIARAAGAPEDTELRIEVGDSAQLLARFAAEERADLIVLGSRARGLRGRQLRCTLAGKLEAATSTPVLIAPPQTRKRSARRLAMVEASATG